MDFQVGYLSTLYSGPKGLKPGFKMSRLTLVDQKV